MGMFDELRCQYPLPELEDDEKIVVQDLLYQTKDTDSQFLDLYEIREDGTLWYEDYDIEDRSDPAAVGLSRFSGAMTRVNQRWEPVTDFTGEIRFYASSPDGMWVEFSSYFLNGQLREVNRIKKVDQ